MYFPRPAIARFSATAASSAGVTSASEAPSTSATSSAWPAFFSTSPCSAVNSSISMSLLMAAPP